MNNKYWLLLPYIKYKNMGGVHKIEGKVKETGMEQRATKKMQNFL